MGQDNAELIAEAREHIDAEIGYGYKSDWDAAQTNPLIARLADALERVAEGVNPPGEGSVAKALAAIVDGVGNLVDK